MEARSAQRRLGLHSGGSVYLANLGGSCLRSGGSWRLGVPSLTTHIHQTSSSRISSIVHYKHTLQASRTSSIIHNTHTQGFQNFQHHTLHKYTIHIHQTSRTSSIIQYTHTLGFQNFQHHTLYTIYTQTNQTSRTSTIILFTLHTIHYTSRTSSIILDFFIFFTTAGVSPLIDTKFHIKLLLKSNSKTKISYFTMHT